MEALINQINGVHRFTAAGLSFGIVIIFMSHQVRYLVKRRSMYEDTNIKRKNIRKVLLSLADLFIILSYFNILINLVHHTKNINRIQMADGLTYLRYHTKELYKVISTYIAVSIFCVSSLTYIISTRKGKVRLSIIWDICITLVSLVSTFVIYILIYL